MTYSLDLAPAFWNLGDHTYEFRVTNTANGTTFQESGWFFVDGTAPLHRGEVMFRRGIADPYSIDGQIHDHMINVDQDTLFQLRSGDATGSRTGALEILHNVTISWRWDAMTDWVVGTHGPVVPQCSQQISQPGFWLRNWGPDFTSQ